MKFKTKLYADFASKMLLILLTILVVLNITEKMNKNMDDIVKDRYAKVKMARDIRFQISNMDRGLINLVFATNSSPLDQQIDSIQKALVEANTQLISLQKVATDDEGLNLVNGLHVLLNSYDDVEKNVIDLVKAGKHIEASDMMLKDALKIRMDIHNQLDELTTIQEGLMEESYQSAQEKYIFAKRLLLVVLAASFILGFLVTFALIRSITNSLKRVTEVISSVSTVTPENLPRIQVLSNDEIGKISIAYNHMAQTLENYYYQEKEIKEKMYDKALLEASVSEMASTYQGVQDVQALSNLILTKMVPMVEASYGSIYVQDDQGIYRRQASYAGKDQEVGISSFSSEEGLIGQCAKENKRLYLADPPKGYIEISSGLGKASPKSIVIIPIEYEGHVLAVIELASFKEFTPFHQSLIEHLSRDMGITINSILGNMKIRELLHESQAITEELQAQSEELQLQQEELKSINEKLEDQFKNSEQKTKELEEIKIELEQKAEQVEQSSKYKSEFLANMSHELRTPLNSILILAQMLAENSEKNLTEKQVEFSQTIYTSGSDLLQLINDVLDLAKIESGKMMIYPEKISLESIEAFVNRQFAPLARTKRIAFSIECEEELPRFIHTDELRLKQIIKNFLSNAFKFTEEGNIDLRIYKADPNRFNESTIAFSVKDTGIGISEDRLNLIFEAFYQIDGTTSRSFGGTGLGLSISREISRLLGGFIEVESEEGKGSTFTLFLPVGNQERKESNLHTQEAAAGMETVPNQVTEGKEILKNKKVLLVDDDMRNVFALTTVLENYEMNVVFAENGVEALEVLQTNPNIDLVLMDIMMPKMDGYEAIRLIRQTPELENLPIIALTAKAMKYDREKCIEAGASDYISKPVDLEQLFSLLKVWLYK